MFRLSRVSFLAGALVITSAAAAPGGIPKGGHGGFNGGTAALHDGPESFPQGDHQPHARILSLGASTVWGLGSPDGNRYVLVTGPTGRTSAGVLKRGSFEASGSRSARNWKTTGGVWKWSGPRPTAPWRTT